jgi:hypothetical protein
LLLGFLALATQQAPASSQSTAVHDEVLDGVLDPSGSAGPTLKAGERQYTLIAKAEYLMKVLRDSRLANRQMHLLGTTLAEGRFEVHRLFSVKDGKLYKVRYYCDTCNITYVEPGNCACCGQPTVLKEIPATQAAI